MDKNHQHHLENNIKKLNCHKLSNKTESSWAEPEPVSSISDTTSEEDVAFCLMMLSRDKWKRKEQHNYQQEQEQETEEEEAEADKSEEETDESDEFKACRTRIRGKYKCETCNKVFKSYQALGGHRASHKKLKVIRPPKEPENAATSSSILAEKRIHECPYCFRVFSSGQALGGHKRSHLTGVAASPAAGSSAKFGDNLNLIDLNLPAPVEDDDASQIELSAVSDAEFMMDIKR
uniref:Zinc finger protein ZAT9-like n=1 Tax=Rhizophora mucronata TaxID=61149 RepID=A0A2P2Q5R3_RHIMU